MNSSTAFGIAGACLATGALLAMFLSRPKSTGNFETAGQGPVQTGFNPATNTLPVTPQPVPQQPVQQPAPYQSRYPWGMNAYIWSMANTPLQQQPQNPYGYGYPMNQMNNPYAVYNCANGSQPPCYGINSGMGQPNSPGAPPGSVQYPFVNPYTVSPYVNQTVVAYGPGGQFVTADGRVHGGPHLGYNWNSQHPSLMVNHYAPNSGGYYYTQPQPQMIQQPVVQPVMMQQPVVMMPQPVQMQQPYIQQGYQTPTQQQQMPEWMRRAYEYDAYLKATGGYQNMPQAYSQQDMFIPWGERGKINPQGIRFTQQQRDILSHFDKDPGSTGMDYRGHKWGAGTDPNGSPKSSDQMNPMDFIRGVPTEGALTKMVAAPLPNTDVPVDDINTGDAILDGMFKHCVRPAPQIEVPPPRRLEDGWESPVLHLGTGEPEHLPELVSKWSDRELDKIIADENAGIVTMMPDDLKAAVAERREVRKRVNRIFKSTGQPPAYPEDEEDTVEIPETIVEETPTPVPAPEKPKASAQSKRIPKALEARRKQKATSKN